MKSPAAFLFLLFALAAGAHAVSDTPGAKALAAANDAWDRGDYITAITEYIRLVDSPTGDAYLEPIALQTGELFVSRELTPDGRAPRFSPDGKLLAYETGLEVSTGTRVVRNDDKLSLVTELPGVSATFSPDGTHVAYLRIGTSEPLRAAQQALERAALAAPNRAALVQALAWQVLRDSLIVVRHLTTQEEREIAVSNLLKTGLTYSADGRSLYFLGAEEGNDARNDIYSVSLTAPKAIRLTNEDGFKNPPLVSADGAALTYVVANQNVFRRPQAPGGGPPPGAPGGRGGQAGQNSPPRPTFGVIDVATTTTTVVDGTAPALSGDGRTLAYLRRMGAENVLVIGKPIEPTQVTVVKKTTDRLDAPALNVDGSRVVYQVMARDDWEIFTARSDGSDERRLTRDVQHDLLPKFLADDRILMVVGEARHRRSFLHDLKSNTRNRLFHNNTVRTIAPEYQWIVSADGNHVLIAAERDGDTVSPARGVYLMDLRRKITKADLLTRLRDNLSGEKHLRASAEKAFAPIAADVRKVVERTSVPRIYAYEKALFDFDSKHITQSGNRLASEYLFNAYASFGYQPEYQWFEPRNALGGKTANVLATLKGTLHPELVYVVSSHYDSVAGGPGADDNTSGTAALLEAARVLVDHPMPATIMFASFTGEEAGLLGSREFVRRAVESKTQIVGALNNDMIGWTNDFRLDNTIRYSNPGIRDIQHGAAMLFTRLITYDALYYKSTDAAAYYEAYGDIVGGIGSYPVLSNPHYHQAHDLLEFENHELIAETSKTTTATLMMLASSPSRLKDLKVEKGNGPGVSLSWTASPEKDVTGYIVSYSVAGAAPRTQRVTTPRITLPQVAAGTAISVKAINKRGLEGWDWARITLP